MAATMERISPFATVAERLRDAGYTPLPAMPGAKVPGIYAGAEWRPMPSWSQWCEKVPPPFISDKWAGWPDAGVCLPHGVVVGLDIDTDRKDVSDAALAAAGPSPVRRRGRKGWMGYYRPGAGVAGHSARIRWYDPAIFNTLGSGKKSYPPQVELLLHGTQSVLPPTIHPDTGRPYVWLTPDTLEDTPPADLPELPDDIMDRLDAEFAKIGLQRRLPESAPRLTDYGRADPGGNDLEKPFGRSLNDRAMRAIDRWWPLLGLPKSRQRGPGAWEAVPAWRPSNSGRDASERNPNLKAVPTGIVDFGADVSYTPIDLVMAALDRDYGPAVDWLEDHVDPEPGMTLSEALAVVAANAPPDPPPPPKAKGAARSALQKFLDRGAGAGRTVDAPMPTSPAEYAEAFPAEAIPFPVRDYERDLTGTLRDMTIWIDAAANMRSEQGALGAAIALLGTILGRKVELAETGLRTNVYVIGTADSGAGKSSAMGAMQRLVVELGVDDRMAGSDFTSDAAILKEIGTGGIPRLFSIDEVGDVIRRVLNPRAASHERGISRILKDMFSSASGIYRGKSYANQERTDIVQPHMCLYGVSTHEAFWEGIDGSSFNDGLLARFLLLPIGATAAQTPRQERFDEVVEGVRAICNHRASAGNLGDMATQPARIDPALFARYMADRELFHRHSLQAAQRKQPGAPSIIMRICENAMKIALISAAARDIENLAITEDDYDLGMAIAHWSAITMINSIGHYYVENGSHRSLKRVLAYIEAGGPDGRTRTQVSRACEGIFVQGKEGDNVLATLKAAEKIIEVAVQKTTRPVTYYVATEHAAVFLERHAPA